MKVLSMLKRGKYYVEPPKNSTDFKNLFKEMTSAGAGRPVDEHGYVIGPWTPDLLADAISQIDNGSSEIDVRTIQLWFQDNNKGISSDNIRRLSRVFGCGDPIASGEWQKELNAAKYRLTTKRRKIRAGVGNNNSNHKVAVEIETILPVDVTLPNRQNVSYKQFNLARTLEGLFSHKSSLNLPVIILAGTVTIGFLAYIMGVHNVTYSPMNGLEKQVGYFWAPNWTILEMVILPLFLVFEIYLLSFWKNEGRQTLLSESYQIKSNESWMQKVSDFTYSYWTALFICFVVVFVIQWSGLYLRAILQNDVGNLMVDWTLMSVFRPDIISVPEAIILSMLGFLYTAAICFVYLIGLIFLYIISHDFYEIYNSSDIQSDWNYQYKARKVGIEIMSEIYRCTVLGILIPTCIKIQATYLLSDGETILKWLIEDALLALGAPVHESKSLDRQSLANFTSFLLLFTTVSVYLFCFIRIYSVLKQQHDEVLMKLYFPCWKMMGVVFLLSVNFFLIGTVVGFTIFFAFTLIIAIYSIIDPLFGRINNGVIKMV